MSKKRVYDDDDGRTIAPMDDVYSTSVFGGWLPSNMSGKSVRRQRNSSDDQQQISSRERLYYVLGALKAALLVALAFIVGLGLVIALMVFLLG